MSKFFLGLVAIATLAGCATGPARVVRYPAYPTVSIVPSPYVDDSLMPVGDHSIPQSQVYIAGFSGATQAMGPVGGLFGHLIGSGIDQSRAYSAVGEARDAMAIKFDAMVAEALKKHTAGAAWKGPPVQLAPPNDRAARIVVMPRARVFILDANTVRLAFQIDVYHAEPDTYGKPSRRLEYHYYVAGSRALLGAGGWGEQDAAAFKAAGAKAMDRLVQVFLEDLRGALPRDAENTRPAKWVPPGTSTFVTSIAIVQERDDYAIALPVVKDRTLRNITLVVEKADLQ